MVEFRVPVATYRLQMNSQFKFADAETITGYLKQLGISDIYASPIFKARPGSMHGYDVIDPTKLNPELGSDIEFESLIQTMRENTLSLLLDIVPNHMGISPGNPFWMDFLQNGSSSRYASFFDIDRTAGEGINAGKVLLPILGKPYGKALEDQEIKLVMHDSNIYLQYYENYLPLNVASLISIISLNLDSLKASRSASDVTRLKQKLTKGKKVDGTAGQTVTLEQLDPHDIESDIRALISSSLEVREHIQKNLDILNGEKGNSRSFDKLDEIINQQIYRLAYWRTGRRELNYRRFFDINTLIGVRVELPEVMEVTHALIFRLIQDGKVDGLRIDHIDGLYNPVVYLKNLQRRTGRFYIVVEKILSGDEFLPGDWPVHGTTGYDFAREVNNLFIDAAGLQKLDEHYKSMIQQSIQFSDVVYEKKKLVIEELFSGETETLSNRLYTLASKDRYARDLGWQDIHQTLVEITACLPVYRTYTHSFEISPIDKRYLELAFTEARRRQPVLEDSALEFLGRVFFLDFPEQFNQQQKQEWLSAVMKWQQFSGPATAKGLEDTALYNYSRLISLNVIGAALQPQDFSIESFHHFNLDRQAHWPATINATSTHDTKRSEDVDARLNVLSEKSREWTVHLSWWRRMNYTSLQKAHGQTVPDPNTEEFLYQSLLGSWPLALTPSSTSLGISQSAPVKAENDARLAEFKERFKSYMIKSVREAKVHTNWIRPDEDYEKALLDFMEAIFENTQPNDFLDEFVHFKREISFFGAINSLSQALLKITSPGLPDFYQGTELWDFSLVDPDNRRPVDYSLRQQLLNELMEKEKENRLDLIEDMLDHWQDGRVKLYLIYKALSLRNQERELYLKGEYIPLTIESDKPECGVAFARRSGESWAITIVPRLSTKLTQSPHFPTGKHTWFKDAIPLSDGIPKQWRNIFTEEKVEVNNNRLLLAEALAAFPVGLLKNEPALSPGLENQ